MAMTKNYYRNAHGALLVYDITREETLHRCTRWLQELRQHADPDICVVLVANKIDLTEERQVPTAMGRAFAKRHSEGGSMPIEFIECSAAAPEDTVGSANVAKAFELLHERMKAAAERQVAGDFDAASGGDNVHLGDQAGAKQGGRSCSSGSC